MFRFLKMEQTFFRDAYGAIWKMVRGNYVPHWDLEVVV